MNLDKIIRSMKVFARVTPDQRSDLEDICLFLNKKSSELIRDLIDETIKRYQRNPQFKRFKIRLDSRKR